MNTLVVTGERSAENYASLLVDELSKKGDFKFFSICSTLLEKKTEKIADFRDISIIGAKEALPILKKAIKTLNETKRTIKEKDIDLVILLDFPEFNLKIAKFAKKLGKKVVYYITPQVWAWRKYRVKQLDKYTDLIIPILPFERFFFKLNNLSKVEYLGHPLVDILHGKIGIHKKENIILLMPGSRKSELELNSRVIFKAAEIIKNNTEGFRFVWIYPKHLPNELKGRLLEDYDFIEIEHDPYEYMDKAFFGILKSGTTTLEAAMFGLPMVVVYKISPASYRMGKILIRNIRFISLPNLISGDEVVKELIQNDATEDKIAEEFFRIYEDKAIYENIRSRLKGLNDILGEYPVTEKIAEKIVSIL